MPIKDTIVTVDFFLFAKLFYFLLQSYKSMINALNKEEIVEF